ncbi:MAG: FUSC family protein [Mobilicoccus sp.]|nr:FUSC family protein [Mobilicoccus sp.]
MPLPYAVELHDVFVRRAAAARRRGRRSISHRWGRLQARLFFLAQIAISAAIAWYIAKEILGHPEPFFAPVAAVVALGLSFGQRLERAVQIVLGVAVGVLVGDIAVAVLGASYWQLALIVFTAMAITTFLDGGVLTTTQAGVQSAIVTILVAAPEMALSRWIDAIVGGSVALLAATITPASPLRKPRQHTAEIVSSMSDLFADAAAALRAEDLDAAERALERGRQLEKSLDTLESLADDGLSVIRSSPFRRRHLPAVQEIADLLEPLARALRNLRVLLRRSSIAVRQGEKVPGHYIHMVEDLAEIASEMAADLGRRELPDARRLALYELAETTTYVTSRPTLSSEVIRAQVRSIVLDLLMVTGLSFEDALTGIPSSYSLHGEPDEVLGYSEDDEGYEDHDEIEEESHDPDPVTQPLHRILADSEARKAAEAQDAGGSSSGGSEDGSDEPRSGSRPE